MSMRGCLLEAARILAEVRAKRGAVKALVLSSAYNNKPQLLAIVCETLRYSSFLNEVIKACGIEREDPDLSLVLLYEHLVGRGLRNAGSIRKIVTSKREEVREFVADALARRGVDSLQELLPSECQSKNDIQIPRYARINSLKICRDEVCRKLAEEGWELCKAQSVREWVDGKPATMEFILDPILPDVLVFPPGTELHNHQLCLNGSLILQDRASCFPAHVLNPDHHGTAIDCCAAPGNKTTHLASLMGNTGTIYAFDRDDRRLGTLRSLLERAGVVNTEVECRDFLTVPATLPPYSQAEFILLDPSCSGSGMIGRMNHLTDDKSSSNPSRLRSLSRFQISLLKHALTFPRVRRIVYSTCSIHAEENEAVVEEVLGQVHDSFDLKNVLPEWPRRGLPKFECGPRCVRTNPREDLTNGFFVACFERRGSSGEKWEKGPDGADESERSDGVEVGGEDETCSALSADLKIRKQKKKKRKKNRKGELEDDSGEKLSPPENQSLEVPGEWCGGEASGPAGGSTREHQLSKTKGKKRKRNGEEIGGDATCCHKRTKVREEPSIGDAEDALLSSKKEGRKKEEGNTSSHPTDQAVSMKKKKKKKKKQSQAEC